MQTNFTYTEEKDIDELISNIRTEDCIEIWASHGKDLEIALWEGWKASKECFTARAPNDKLLCITGVTPVESTLLVDAGCPWLVTTNEVENHKKRFMKESKVVTDYWRTHHEYLVNYVDARYKRALKWAKWVGFTVYDPIPYGPYDLPFCYIEMRGK